MKKIDQVIQNLTDNINNLIIKEKKPENVKKERVVWEHLKECDECDVAFVRCEVYNELREKAPTYVWGPW